MIEQDNYLLFSCPHCLELVMVAKKELNCCIFRHAIYKNSYDQVNAHLDKRVCEYLTRENLVFGCSKPFKIVYDGLNYEVIKCDYI